MSSNGHWKKHFLRTGVPLEYEVGQILAKRGMAVSADVGFIRYDGDTRKEHSVDISADWFGSGRSPTLNLNALVECKYRSPNKTIIAFRDPNHDYPPATLGGTINYFDKFVPRTIHPNAFVALERRLDFAYKILEIGDDGAHDEQMIHGIQQLRYCTPRHLRQSILFSSSIHFEEVLPVFFCSIFVTNASIRLMNEGCSLSSIEHAVSLDEVSAERDAIILYSDYGPDYRAHFKREMDGISEEFEDWLPKLYDNLRVSGKDMNAFEADPDEALRRLEEGERFLVRRFSTQFFVVTLSGLDDLVRRIQSPCANAVKKSRLGDREAGA